MNKALKIIALVIIIGGLLFAIYKLYIQPEKKQKSDIIKAQENSKTKDQIKKEASLPVKAFTVEKGNLPLRLRISATADVWEKATIKSEVRGKVIRIYHKIGDHVKPGALLVKIDDAEKKLEVESRKANKLETLSKFLVKEKIDNPFNFQLSEKQKNELKAIEQKYKKAVSLNKFSHVSECNPSKVVLWP